MGLGGATIARTSAATRSTPFVTVPIGNVQLYQSCFTNQNTASAPTLSFDFKPSFDELLPATLALSTLASSGSEHEHEPPEQEHEQLQFMKSILTLLVDTHSDSTAADDCCAFVVAVSFFFAIGAISSQSRSYFSKSASLPSSSSSSVGLDDFCNKVTHFTFTTEPTTAWAGISSSIASCSAVCKKGWSMNKLTHPFLNDATKFIVLLDNAQFLFRFVLHFLTIHEAAAVACKDLIA
jgi:hypothetical protein